MAGTGYNQFDGTAIVFGTSAWTSVLTGIDWSGMSRPAILFKESNPTAAAATNFGTVVKRPSLNVDGGNVTLSVHFDPDNPPVFAIDPETITITWPKVTADATAATWSFSGFVTDYSLSGAAEGGITADLVVAVSDETTVTEAA